jgi:vanillate O-demethylase ferredoxin subunit
MFDHAVRGRQLQISAPRNQFPLAPAQPGYLLLSGGIGATPIIGMLYALRAAGVRCARPACARWIHLCRSADNLAFRPWIRDLGAFHDVVVHVDAEAGGLHDLNAELRHTPADHAVYCCGPAPLMAPVQRFGDECGRWRAPAFRRLPHGGRT